MALAVAASTGRTWEQILAPIHEEALQLGYTDVEEEADIDESIREHRSERRQHLSPRPQYVDISEVLKAVFDCSLFLQARVLIGPFLWTATPGYAAEGAHAG